MKTITMMKIFENILTGTKHQPTQLSQTCKKKKAQIKGYDVWVSNYMHISCNFYFQKKRKRKDRFQQK